MNQNIKCPKCEKDMQIGYLLDHGHLNSTTQTHWVEGEPQKGFFGLKIKSKKVLPTSTFRCPKCGFIELYAPENDNKER
jgi:predicted nucleic-acid-binding Zn-ribbon protein